NIYGVAGLGTVIDTSSGGPGGDVILLAGAANSTAGGITQVTGPSGRAGDVTGIRSINTSGNPSGNITLGSFNGSVTVGPVTARGTNGVSPTTTGGSAPVITIPGVITIGGSSSTTGSAPPPKGQLHVYAPVSITVGDVNSNGTNPAYD